VSTAHNTILLAGAETGVPGGLAILLVNVGLAGMALRGAWRGRSRDRALLLAFALALGAFLAQGMFNNLFSVPADSVVFALVIGAMADDRQGEASEGPTARGPAGPPPARPYTSPASHDHALDGEP
jgi:O-antigen ligase